MSIEAIPPISTAETAPHSTITLCDMCGRTLSYGENRGAVSDISLCEQCARYLDGLKEPVKGNVIRFLIGNVL